MKEKLFKGTLIQMMGAALAGAAVYTYNPIGIAFFTAVLMIKGMGAIAFPIMILSMYLTMNYVLAAKYAMVLVAILGCIGIMNRIVKREKSVYVYGAIAGVITTIMELTDNIMLVANPTLPIALSKLEKNLVAVMLGILVFCLTIIFNMAIGVIMTGEKDKIYKNEEMISMGLTIAFITYYLGSVNLWGFSPIEAFIYFTIVFTAYKYGAGIGGVIGCASGAVLTLWSGDPSMLGIMSMLGIISGAFRQLGRLGSLAGLVSGVAIAGILYEPELLTKVWIQGLIIAGGIFIVLPPNIVHMFKPAERANEAKQKGKVFGRDLRLQEIADAFEKLSKSFGQFPMKRQELTYDEVSLLVEEVSSKHCVNCIRADQCWNKGKYEAYKETAELFKIANEKGRIYVHDVQKSFATRCRNINGLVAEVNHLFERARINLLWHNRLVDSKVAVAAQLQEVSGIINDYSKETYNLIGIEPEKEEMLRQQLKARKIILQRITMLENRNRKIEIAVTVKSIKGVCVSTKDIETVIEAGLGKRIRPVSNSKIVIGSEYNTINFVEDVNFSVLYGTAKKAKGKEKVSGDNFGFTSLNCGQMLMTISDGMGHGQGAYTESETVIELLEQMLESGFREEVALKLINLVLMLNSDAGNTATVDMGIVDQYSGVCDFIKLGAAPTFIKRGNWVEVIKSTSLPLGVLEMVDYERVSKKLYDGDFIIMVSDGVIDAVGGDEKEYELCEIIKNTSCNNTKEFANRLLEEVMGGKDVVAKDDMTVLVGAVWSKV